MTNNKKYFTKLHEMKNSYEEYGIEKCEPYFYFSLFDSELSPAERIFWNDLRSVGLVRFYPQFPVKNFYLDFADPIRKIGIEIDGKEWHKDYEKDRLRQEEIEREGWIVYRLPASRLREDMSDLGEACEGKYYSELFCDSLKSHYGYRGRKVAEDLHGFIPSNSEQLISCWLNHTTSCK